MMTKLEERKSALIALIIEGIKPKGTLLRKLYDTGFIDKSGWSVALLWSQRMRDLKRLYIELNN